MSWASTVPDLSVYHGQKIGLFGFSYGGYKAIDVAKQFPDIVEKVILLGMRPHYSMPQIRMVGQQLKRDSAAYLKFFYRSCFASDRQWAWFLEQLWPSYSQTPLVKLLDQLDYLSTVNLASLRGIPLEKLHLFHGRADAISPLSELEQCADVPQNRVVVLPGGHLPFWADLQHGLNQIT